MCDFDVLSLGRVKMSPLYVLWLNSGKWSLLNELSHVCLFSQQFARLLQRILRQNGVLTHWGRVTHICVAKLTINGSDNGLSPGRRQAIIWTNAGILLIRPSGRNFSEILIEIHTFSFKKIHVKMSSAKRPSFCLGLNVLNPIRC